MAPLALHFFCLYTKSVVDTFKMYKHSNYNYVVESIYSDITYNWKTCALTERYAKNPQQQFHWPPQHIKKTFFDLPSYIISTITRNKKIYVRKKNHVYF